MERTGKCLCGAVSYSAELNDAKITVCHCDMCLRWAGGPFMSVDAASITFTNEENVQTFTSSAWAERAFCATCGSNLFYRVTAPGKHHGHIALLFGSLNDRSGFSIRRELFIDKKPSGYTFDGDHPTVTEAEVMAMFGES